MIIHAVTATEYTIRTEMLNGKEHLVVPVVMMVEGVHSGSHGPLLHLAEELGKFTGAWDGRPVTISHPSVDGQNVSASSPSVLEALLLELYSIPTWREHRLKLKHG